MKEDGTPIRIGFDGVEWAYNLGKTFRETTIGYKGLRADRVCPFKEGTPHRLCWYAGWKGASVPLGLANA